MKRDEERKANAKDDEWNQEVGIGQDGPCLFRKSHLHPALICELNLRQHNDGAPMVSRMPGRGSCCLILFEFL